MCVLLLFVLVLFFSFLEISHKYPRLDLPVPLSSTLEYCDSRHITVPVGIPGLRLHAQSASILQLSCTSVPRVFLSLSFTLEQKKKKGDPSDLILITLFPPSNCKPVTHKPTHHCILGRFCFCFVLFHCLERDLRRAGEGKEYDQNILYEIYFHIIKKKIYRYQKKCSRVQEWAAKYHQHGEKSNS